jgi:tetratricopeptide (TPR) repeat protein
MGARTQNHIIEEESRLFFKSLLPGMWVCRDKSEDYGIDCEVEIFDEKGNPTALVFWVQLKGTASKETKVIQQFSFKNEKLDQLRKYNLPVLIARYSTINKTIFFRWAKSVYQLNRDGKSTKVLFLDQDEWDIDTPDKIKNYLYKQNIITQGGLRFPIKTFLQRRASSFGSTVPYSNLVLIKNYTSVKSNYFTITNEECDALLQINIEQQQIVFSFTDLAFATLGLDFSILSAKIESDVSKYIMVTFCASLFELHRKDLGSTVFLNENLFPIVSQVPSYLSDLLPHLLTGPEMKKIMRLLNTFLKEEQHNNFIEGLVNIFMLWERDNLDDEQLELVEEFLLQNILQAKKWNTPMLIGISCYNLANFYRGINAHEAAVLYYLELAGQLFLLGRYKFAESCYRKALALDPTSYMVKALIADCMICSGQYKLGITQLDEFLMDQHDKTENLDEWYLKYSCFQTLLEHGYPEMQVRNTERSDILAAQGEFDNALMEDMLCPLAWFNKGVTDSKEHNDCSAFFAFTMAGIICNKDISAWANATLLGLNESIDKTFLIYVIRTAHFFNGQKYINSVFHALGQTNDEHRNVIMELMDKTLPKTPERPAIVRVFQDETTYTPIHLKHN